MAPEENSNKQERDIAGRRFTTDEVSDIVRRGLSRQHPPETIGYDELTEVAKQSGLSEEQIDEAIRAHDRAQALETVRHVVERRRLRAFYTHLRVYVAANAALFVVDLATAGPTWFHWPLLGWGFGLAFHGLVTYFPDRDKEERRARRIVRRREAKRQ